MTAHSCSGRLKFLYNLNKDDFSRKSEAKYLPFRIGETSAGNYLTSSKTSSIFVKVKNENQDKAATGSFDSIFNDYTDFKKVNWREQIGETKFKYKGWDEK